MEYLPYSSYDLSNKLDATFMFFVIFVVLSTVSIIFILVKRSSPDFSGITGTTMVSLFFCITSLLTAFFTVFSFITYNNYKADNIKTIEEAFEHDGYQVNLDAMLDPSNTTALYPIKQNTLTTLGEIIPMGTLGYTIYPDGSFKIYDDLVNGKLPSSIADDNHEQQ